jgi:hypothetical protein
MRGRGGIDNLNRVLDMTQLSLAVLGRHDAHRDPGGWVTAPVIHRQLRTTLLASTSTSAATRWLIPREGVR